MQSQGKPSGTLGLPWQAGGVGAGSGQVLRGPQPPSPRLSGYGLPQSLSQWQVHPPTRGSPLQAEDRAAPSDPSPWVQRCSMNPQETGWCWGHRMEHGTGSFLVPKGGCKGDPRMGQGSIPLASSWSCWNLPASLEESTACVSFVLFVLTSLLSRSQLWSR